MKRRCVSLLLGVIPFLLLAALAGAEPQDKLPPAPEGFDARRGGVEKGNIESVEYDSKAVGGKLVFPDGREQVVLSVPRYDFNWQLGYDLTASIKIPKGTKLVVIAHFDNSANNKFNPDPNRTVYFGNMTWEEMFTPFFAITVDKSVDPKKAVKSPGAFGNGA